MKVTLAELHLRIRSRLSEEDLEWFKPENLTRFLNEGQDILAAAAPYTAHIVTETDVVPGSSVYLLDERILKPTTAAIVHDDGTSDGFDYQEPNIFDYLREGRRGSSRPYCTYRDEADGTSIMVTPVPDDETDILAVRGYRYPKPLVEDEDATEVPTRHVHILVNYGFWRCKEKDEEQGQARMAREQFEKDLLGLKRDRAIKQYQAKTRTYGQRERGG